MIRILLDDLADALGIDADLVREILEPAHRRGLVFLVGPSVLLRGPTAERLRLERDDDGRWQATAGLLDAVPSRPTGAEAVDAEGQADPRQRPPWEEAADAEPLGRVEAIRGWLAARG